MLKRAGNDASADFSGRRGKRRLVEALKSQTLVSESSELARALAKSGDLTRFEAGEVLIEQGGLENDVFLIIKGEVSIHVNDRAVATRSAGTHVGEMALVDPLAKRSATVRAVEPTVTLRVPEHRFSQIAGDYPDLWRRVAVELAKRLRERNKALRQPHNKSVLFIGSSVEGQPVANEVYRKLRRKEIIPRPWSEGVFQASRTSIENLVNATQEADFAALVLTTDDMTISRGKANRSPRDNVIFELGLFMGALGRERVFILKPKGVDVRIPSDLFGVVWLEYLRAGPWKKRLGATCGGMLDRISSIGPR